jgi:phage shock protein PspC (stress-responsive transcriptional regulator)
MNRRLYRSRHDSVLGGVAGGVAEYLDVDPSIVRVIWAILGIVTGGLFVLLYIVMWIVVPESPYAGPAGPAGPPAPPGPAFAGAPPPAGDAGVPPTPAAPEPGVAAPAWEAPAPAWVTPPPRHRSGGSGGALIFGLILIAAGVWFLIDQYLPAFDRRFVWPVALVLVGLVLLVIAMRRPRPE